MDTPKVLFEAQYCYRRKEALFAALFFLAAGLITGYVTSNGLKVVNVSGIAVVAVLLGLAAWLFVRFLKHHTLESRIDTSGITCDGKHWSWEQVSWLAGHPRSNGVSLFFQARGTMSPDQTIWTKEGLTTHQYEELLKQLDVEIRPRFPDVKFG
jgi:hypothetical protein